MRILQINSICGVGSTGRIATDIHHRLLSLGHTSNIAYARKKALHCENPIRFGGKLNFLTHVAYTFATDRHGFASRRATRQLLPLIDQFQPDLIHLQAIHGYYVNIEMLFNYLKTKQIPVVWTMHDCWAFTGHCAHFDYAGCDKWKTGCHDCPEKYQYPISLLLDNSRRNYREKRTLFNGLDHLTLVSPSQWLADLTRQSFLQDYPVRVIPNGVNLDVFRPQDSQFRYHQGIAGQFIILGVATIWRERKGWQTVLELAKRLADDEVLVLVGLNSQQFKQLPVDPQRKRIIGIARTHNIQELAEIYTSADVFINPTLEDNFPTTNLEALACGTPVVTYRTGGSVESISPETGLIAEKGDLDDLLVKIRQIKATGKAHYSAACRQRAEMLYERGNNYQHYIDLYSEMLALTKP